jgi:penicillin-binding protein 1B
MGFDVAKVVIRVARVTRARPRLLLAASVSLLLLTVVAVAGVLYIRIERFVDQRIAGGLFPSTIDVYATPRIIARGQAATPDTVAAILWRARYSDRGEVGTSGRFRIAADSLLIWPSTSSYTQGPPVEIRFEKSRIASITDITTRRELSRYTLDPQLLSNLSGSVRERRRVIRHGDMPGLVVDALLAVEDRNFFHHHGFDLPRLAKAAWINTRSGRPEQGGSTLTMQLARSFWLTSDKTWRRKLTELMIALVLERKLTKEQILEHYVNQVYLGNHETYEIRGFGEAAWRYFNRDMAQLTLPQAALLVGMIQRPNYFNPQRQPERALERRNLALAMMRRTGAIGQAELEQAVQAPLDVNPRSLDRGDAPYFVDLALQQAQQVTPARAGSVKLYTTIDLELQGHAEESIRAGLERLDRAVAKKNGYRPPPPQVALVALDARTGEVRAAVGGRNYGESQLNRLLAKRQPGSAFKPFVYAAALESQLGTRGKTFTGATLLDDSPTMFKFGNELYAPANFGDTFRGPVLLRRALTSSLNVPTVALAAAVGYRRVAELARRVGLPNVRATPAAALGAYDATPLEIATAYTVFANEGHYAALSFLTEVRNADGRELYRHQPKPRPALDPRVSWLMVDMLQDVLRYGTGASVSSYGLRAPAAGKTGTSRDGWFAGFTSELICVVWTGYDDNRDLSLEGAKSALPIWAEFMKRATAHGAYARPFPDPPPGLVKAEIDVETGELASNASRKTRAEFFLSGSEPSVVATAESLEALRAKKEEKRLELLAARVVAQPAGPGPPVATTAGGQTGTANWYRSKPGEELVAASPVLASGTRVKVTNVSTGKSLVVTIAGWIPPESGYVISLAQPAASELDFVRHGLAQVRVEPVDP